MGIWLAVVAFCVGEQCAFFVSDELFQEIDQCEARAAMMEQQILRRTKGEAGTIPGCVRVPMKVT